MFYHGGKNMNNTKRSIISILSVIMLVGIIAGLVPSKIVNAAPYISSNITITNSVNANVTGYGRPTVFEEDKDHTIKCRVSGLTGRETVVVKVECTTFKNNPGGTSNTYANGRSSVEVNYKFSSNKWGNIWVGEYRVSVLVDGKQVGGYFYFSSIRRSAANFIKDLYKFVDSNVSGVCVDAFNISIGKTSPADVARKYFNYSSFQTKSRSMSNREYVRRLYISILGRSYDQGGWDYWTNCLNAGQPREQVLEGFLNSAEFQNRHI